MAQPGIRKRKAGARDEKALVEERRDGREELELPKP
jgi:hypothetical protein